MAINLKNIITETTAKDTLVNAVNALTKTFGGKKIDKNYVKKYLKSIEQIARKKPGQFVKDYGTFSSADWIEDAQYNLQNEGKLNEGDRDTYTWKQINDVLFDLRMPDKHILMVRKALKKSR